MLAKLTAPDMKVEIVEVLSTRGKRAGASSGAPGSPRKRGSGGKADDKLVLARCRLLIGLSATASSGAEAGTGAEGGGDQDRGEEEEDDDDEVHGVVAFSLHLHPAATAAAASSTAGGAPPVLPPPASKHSTQKRAAASLFLPSHQHDLRFLRAGVEVWVWGPYEEVVVGTGETRGTSGGEGEAVEEEGREVGETASGRSGGSQGSEGRVAVALVCSRFGVLV